MALRIELRPGEQMVINGALVEALGRVRIMVQNRASLLRSKDLMKPEAANTPAKRLFFACMMAYMDEEALEIRHQVADLLGDLMQAFSAPEAIAVCAQMAQFLAEGDFYQALGTCKKLIEYEAQVFAVAESELG